MINLAMFQTCTASITLTLVPMVQERACGTTSLPILPHTKSRRKSLLTLAVRNFITLQNHLLIDLGGPSGGATLVKPLNNWDNRDLPVYFSRVPNPITRTSTRYIPAATGDINPHNELSGRKRAGVIAGAVLGALVILAILLSLVLFLLHLKKTQRRSQMPSSPLELPAEPPQELCGDSMDQSQNSSRPLTQAYFSSLDLTQSTSPNYVSPPSHPAQQIHHVGSSTEYGISIPSVIPSQCLPGLYPLGAYYPELQSLAVPLPPEKKQLEDPANSLVHPSRRSRQLATPSPSYSDYKDAFSERPPSVSMTPGQFYLKPSNDRRSPILSVEEHGESRQYDSVADSSSRETLTKIVKAGYTGNS
jgi:hypothetical protein